MTKLAIIEAVVEMIEELRKAQPGSGPAEQRAAHRAAANTILERLPRKWHEKIKPDLWNLYSSLV